MFYKGRAVSFNSFSYRVEWGDFLTSKIVYQELTQGSCFYYDEKAEYFILQTAYFISGNTNLDYLTKLLNSKFIEYCFRKFYSTSMGKSGFRWLSQYVEKLPIALYDNTAIQQKIVLCSHQTDDENIDNLIYQMYGLTQEEISTIEQS